ncbi:glycine-rich RNA-binding protein [Salix suchowensis]|nr:glycine-rich RNA-binding protein [Salix suchowensis]
MAFLTKVGNMFRQTANRQITSEISVSGPSIYQALRYMSSSKLFVGGISFQTDDNGLKEAFDKYGNVVEARIIMDLETGRSRGFGFITYTSSEEASSAIQAMDGQDLHGRRVRVNYATERPQRTFNNNYGNYGGGGYGSGGEGYGSGGGGYGGGGYGSGGGGYGGGGGYSAVLWSQIYDLVIGRFNVKSTGKY